MKHFLYKIATYILAILLLSFALDAIISWRLYHSKTKRYQSNTEMIDGINTDLLIMGSSRAASHYSPMILDSILGTHSYNLGYDGNQFNRQNMRYNIYHQFNNPPKVILQNIDIITLGYTNKGYEAESFMPYLWNMDCRKLIDKDMFSWEEKYIPLYRYLRNLNIFKIVVSTTLDIIPAENRHSIQQGFVTHQTIKPWDGTEFAKIDTLHFGYNEESAKLFVDYVTKATEEGIQMIFVYSPIYIGATNKVVDLEQMYSTFNSIAQENNIPILDYTYSSLSYDTTYFSNATHLNKIGAELFSTMLANDLDSLGIIE